VFDRKLFRFRGFGGTPLTAHYQKSNMQKSLLFPTPFLIFYFIYFLGAVLFIKELPVQGSPGMND